MTLFSVLISSLSLSVSLPSPLFFISIRFLWMKLNLRYNQRARDRDWESISLRERELVSEQRLNLISKQKWLWSLTLWHLSPTNSLPRLVRRFLLSDLPSSSASLLPLRLSAPAPSQSLFPSILVFLLLISTTLDSLCEVERFGSFFFLGFCLFVDFGSRFSRFSLVFFTIHLLNLWVRFQIDML